MKFNKLSKILLTSVIMAFSMNSMAAMSVKDFEKKLKASNPKLEVEEIEYISNVNLYEFRAKDSTMLTYTNENLDFFLTNGQIIDPKNKKVINEERSLANVKKWFDKLPFDTSIKAKFGKGTKKIAIFTDPDCPFCKQLDKEIHSKLQGQDVTIHYFMNPLNIQGHEEAPLKARKIYCSSNKDKAWKDWMLEGKLPNNKGECKNPVADHKNLARSVGFSSTPVMIFENGTAINSGLSGEEIIQLLK